MTILLTGGAGYIGSHTAAALIESGYDVVLADDYRNSNPLIPARLERLTGHAVPACKVDVCDPAALHALFDAHPVDAVVHLAGLKAVGESVQEPLRYYRNNLDASLTLLECMKQHGVHRLVFSSSATVYGAENPVPYTEEMPRGVCSSPYGWTKAMIEQIFTDAAAADPEMSVVLLRYFNPVGAHPSGLIGEEPRGVPNNLLPFVAQVAAGRREKLTVFGGDYPTPDGTCRRDYLHVCDLARGHVCALEYAAQHTGTAVFNLGTGIPHSVLEVVDTFARVSGADIPYEIGPRRTGDLAEFWADPARAKAELGWSASCGLEDMCRDAWNFQRENPNGYEG